MNNSFNSVLMTDKKFQINYVNGAFEKITGKKAQVIDKNPRILKSFEHSDEWPMQI